ncbi:MAG: hypothetical protein OXI43_13545 [Candidatus Poribacteria bacterium]|nr:hypothetical protein [Candidatus Poribacteria bacterium]
MNKLNKLSEKMDISEKLTKLPKSVQWLIFIAFCIIIPLLPISDFHQGMLAGFVIMIFILIDSVEKKDESK